MTTNHETVTMTPAQAQLAAVLDQQEPFGTTPYIDLARVVLDMSLQVAEMRGHMTSRLDDLESRIANDWMKGMK